MIKEEIRNNIILKLGASVVFGFLSYYFTTFRISGFRELINYLGEGAVVAKTTFFGSDFFSKLPNSPAIFFWLLIGLAAYFFYYSLSLVYTDISNWLIIETTYANTGFESKTLDLTKVKRLILHSLVVVYYLSASLVTYFVSIPISNFLQRYVVKVLGTFSPLSYNFYLSFIPSFLFWFVMFSVFSLVLRWLLGRVIDVDLEEEHDPKEIVIGPIHK